MERLMNCALIVTAVAVAAVYISIARDEMSNAMAKQIDSVITILGDGTKRSSNHPENTVPTGHSLSSAPAGHSSVELRLSNSFVVR